MLRRHRALSGASLALLLVVAHAVNDSFSGMLSALLPTFQLRFGASETLLATLVATQSFSSSVTQPVFGALADRLGRRIVGALGVVTSSALLSLMGRVESVWLLFALLLVGGLGSAAFHPSGTSIARAAARSTKGLAVGIFSAGGTIGLAFGPLIIGYFIINDLLEFSPWLMIPGLILGALLYLLVPVQERAPRENRPKLFDAELFRGPVGTLCFAGILRSIAWVTLINGAPLWLVHERGIAADSATLFWTLTFFSFFGGLGGIAAGYLEKRLGREALISGSMLLALIPLYALFLLPAGSPVYFLAVALAGALVNGGLPLMVVSAQDLAPHAMGTASGMLMGLTWGTAGVVYILVGGLQEAIGIGPAMAISFSTLVPGSLLALKVLRGNAQALSAD
ncbi:MAG TPA: MFS transporter [Trueperaceae bacterium]